ncbi:MAG: TolC family outer membrane protein [Caulobacterales bacterium]
MRRIALFALVLALAQTAHAETLSEAMSSAAQSNPTIAAQRERLRATREALPQAWAAALPQASISASASSGDRYGVGAGPSADRSEGWSGGVSASQLLFDTGATWNSTRQARAQIAGAMADYDGAYQQLLLDVASAYANVRQSQAIVAARETTVSNLTEQQRFVTAQFEAGVVTRTDQAQADARLAQARTQLVQAQGQLAAAVEAYVRLVGHAPSDLSAPAEAQGLPADLEAALTQAIQTNPSLIGALASARQADAAVDSAWSNFGPRVSLEAGASLGSDFDQSNDDYSSDSVGVRFSMPLFTGGANASRVRQQRALRSAANLDVASVQRTTRELVTNSWTGLQSARSAVTSAQDQVRASELAYRGIRLEQETGLRTTIDVLNQEADLLTARLALAQAERDLVIAERQMLASMGVLTAQ